MRRVLIAIVGLLAFAPGAAATSTVETTKVPLKATLETDATVVKVDQLPDSVRKFGKASITLERQRVTYRLANGKQAAIVAWGHGPNQRNADEADFRVGDRDRMKARGSVLVAREDLLSGKAKQADQSGPDPAKALSTSGYNPSLPQTPQLEPCPGGGYERSVPFKAAFPRTPKVKYWQVYQVWTDGYLQQAFDYARGNWGQALNAVQSTANYSVKTTTDPARAQLWASNGQYGATGWAGLTVFNLCEAGLGAGNATGVALNSSYLSQYGAPGYEDLSNGYAQRNVAAHEIGHWLGLGHSGFLGSIMSTPVSWQIAVDGANASVAGNIYNSLYTKTITP